MRREPKQLSLFFGFWLAQLRHPKIYLNSQKDQLALKSCVFKVHLNIILLALVVCVLECLLLSLQDVRVICVCVGIIRVAQVVA